MPAENGKPRRINAEEWMLEGIDDAIAEKPARRIRRTLCLCAFATLSLVSLPLVPITEIFTPPRDGPINQYDSEIP